MNISIIHALATNEAAVAFPLLQSLLAWRLGHAADGDALVVEAPRGAWPAALGVAAPTLLFSLPEQCAEDLEQLAAAPIDVFNRHSEDLLSCRTVMQLQSERFSIEVDVWVLGTFPEDSAGHNFFLCLATGSQAVLVEHRFDAHEWEALMAGLQAACCGSGPNYNPWRLWSPQQLEDAAGAQSPLEDSRHRLECRVLTATPRPGLGNCT